MFCQSQKHYSLHLAQCFVTRWLNKNFCFPSAPFQACHAVAFQHSNRHRRPSGLFPQCKQPVARAEHSGNIAQKHKDDQLTIRRAALQTIGRLEPAALFQHAGAIARNLEDLDSDVRHAARRLRNKYHFYRSHISVTTLRICVTEFIINDI